MLAVDLAVVDPIFTEDHVKLIYHFGPAALLLFVVAVLLPTASHQASKHPTERLHKNIYISVWALIAALTAASVAIFIFVNLKEETFIRGSIAGLPDTYEVASDLNPNEVQVYFQKYKDYGTGLTRYSWLATRDHRLSEQNTLSIRVYKPIDKATTSEYSEELKLRVDDTYYQNSVEIIYHPSKDSYVLRIPGREEETIKGEPLGEEVEPLKSRDLAINAVYAATSLDAVAMKSRLEATDPAVRRDARYDLAKLGPEGLPFIDKALSDSSSSPALLFGVLSSLNLMQQDLRSETQLGGHSLTIIIRSTNSDNADIAGQANAYITRRTPQSIHAALAAWLKSNQSPGIRLNDPALADMDLLYKIGMEAKNAYHVKGDEASFVRAQSAFEQGWSDRQFAVPTEQVYFAKALYGWGLLLEDRAITKSKGKSGTDADLVRVAQGKFREFLAAVAPHQNFPKYPDDSHVKHAKAYVTNPKRPA